MSKKVTLRLLIRCSRGIYLQSKDTKRWFTKYPRPGSSIMKNVRWKTKSHNYKSFMYQKYDYDFIEHVEGTTGHLTCLTKTFMFLSLSQNYHHLFEKWYIHLTVNCPRNSKMALKVKQARRFLEFVIKTYNYLNCFIKT